MSNPSLRMDEASNAIDYLEKAVRFLREVEAGELIAWKWVCISAHGALYGFAVAAATGTNWYSVTYERKDGSRGLKNFDDILKLCQNQKHMKMLVHSKPLKLDDEQRRAIKFIKDQLRNEFQHFVPKGWTLFVDDGLPRIVGSILEITNFLALETGTYLQIHIDATQQTHIAALVKEGSEICERLRVKYEAT